MSESLSNGEVSLLFKAEREGSKPIDLRLDGAIKFANDWAAYGSIWGTPETGMLGGKSGVNLGDSLEIFANGSINKRKDFELGVGLKLSF